MRCFSETAWPGSVLHVHLHFGGQKYMLMVYVAATEMIMPEGGKQVQNTTQRSSKSGAEITNRHGKILM